MLQIIQDFKDWKNAHSDLQYCEKHFIDFKKNLVQICDEQTWTDNKAKEKLFNENAVPSDFITILNALTNVDNYVSRTNLMAQKYRASSCYYRFGNKEAKCINLSFDKPLTEKRCGIICDKYFLLKNYQRIFAELQNKKQQCEFAKQKLLDDFMFWKTK